ncbi:MAG: DUF4292 domain-containing protein [Muribaculaceae bacterium]|nr:DUF4292 domain-containing protein [Muribaculaceae bacterium]
MKRILKQSITLLLLLVSVLPASASGSSSNGILSKKEMRALASRMEAAYKPWEEVTVKGKFRMEGLPVSPGMKLYMVRDSLLVMSLTAPFVGEAARIEMDTDSITLVNKMKRTMTRLPVTALEKFFPGTLTDFQDFLLGNVVICGHGPVSADMASGLECYPAEEDDPDSGELLLVPADEWQPDGARYGYVLTEDLAPASLVVEIEGCDDYVQMDYTRDRGGKTLLDIIAAIGPTSVEGQLQLETPSGKAQPIRRFVPSSDYVRVPLKRLLKF